MSHFLRISVIGGVLLFFSVAPPMAFAADAFQITKLDGSQAVVSIAGIETDGRIRLAGTTKPIELSGLRRLRRVKAAGATGSSGDVTLRLEYGGVLKSQSVAVKNEKVTVSLGKNRSATLPLETVRAVRFTPKPSPLFQRALETPSADYDRFFIRIEGKVRTVRGLLETLDVNSAALVVNDRNVKIQRADLQGIVFASAKPKKLNSGIVRVHLNDDSRIVAKIDSLSKAGELKLKLSPGTEVSVPWANVNSIDVYSDRLQYLSDLKPVAVNETAVVTLTRKWRKDASVTGGPLSVGSKTYEKGLGVHARSELTFAVDGLYESFSAVIGLDDRNGKKGDCEFIVQADGRELYRKRLTGKDKPVRVNVKITGAKRLTLLVEPGKNLDIADHANWCAASLIRPPR